MVIFNVVSGHMICAAVMCDLYMRDQWLVGLLEILLRIHECAISLFTQKKGSTHNSTRNSDSGMNMMVFELYLGTHYKYTFMYIIIYNIHTWVIKRLKLMSPRFLKDIPNSSLCSHGILWSEDWNSPLDLAGREHRSSLPSHTSQRRHVEASKTSNGMEHKIRSNLHGKSW